jgi:hypothetical protein
LEPRNSNNQPGSVVVKAIETVPAGGGINPLHIVEVRTVPSHENYNGSGNSSSSSSSNTVQKNYMTKMSNVSARWLHPRLARSSSSLQWRRSTPRLHSCCLSPFITKNKNQPVYWLIFPLLCRRHKSILSQLDNQPSSKPTSMDEQNERTSMALNDGGGILLLVICTLDDFQQGQTFIAISNTKKDMVPSALASFSLSSSVPL